MAAPCGDPPIEPDYAVMHASEVDIQGNVRVAGTYHWDRIMTRAAKSVLVVAERLVNTEIFESQPEMSVVPHFMVEAFAIVPRGAWPGSCWPAYAIDYPAVERYLEPGDVALAEHMRRARRRRTALMPEEWSPFSYIVINLARFIRPNEITFSGVNSTIPMLACLLAKCAYDFPFTYINVAGGVDPRPSHIPLSSSDPVLAEHSASIFANEDFYDLCTRGRMDLTFLRGCADRRRRLRKQLGHRELGTPEGTTPRGVVVQ